MKPWLLVVLLATGCGPYLSMQSSAPPGRTARLDEVRGFWGLKGYRVELTEGIALAVSCEEGGPCEKMTIKADDPKVVDVRTASFGVLDRNAYTGAIGSSTAFVLVGKARGATNLHLKTKDGSRVIAVTIVAPPQPSPPATVAK
ncbi:MAG TPA: hypothetical protein VFQ53_00255 [Kofleriaceae bacterium]|nr:hypothetical protein [Kofleriaceae bacterium]